MATTKKNKTDGRGGKREGAGRKTTLSPEEKKIPIFIYPKQMEVDSLGGKDAVKALCESYITKQSKDKK